MVCFLCITSTINFYNIHFMLLLIKSIILYTFLLYIEANYKHIMLCNSILELIFKVYGNYIPQNNPNNGFKISHFWGNLGETKKSTV